MKITDINGRPRHIPEWNDSGINGLIIYHGANESELK